LDFGLVGIKMIIHRVVLAGFFRFAVAWQLVSLSNLTFAQSPTTKATESSTLRNTNRIVENADQPSLVGQSINSTPTGEATGDVRADKIVSFQILATGGLRTNLGTSVTYGKEEPYVDVVLSPGFSSNTNLSSSIRTSLEQAQSKYKSTFGEYHFLPTNAELLRVEQYYKQLADLLNQHVSETVIVRGKEVAEARKVLLKYVEAKESSLSEVEAKQIEELRLELTEVERQAYRRLLQHCSPKDREAFELLVHGYHYASMPLPSILHYQILEKPGFQNPLAPSRVAGWELNKACMIVPYSNSGLIAAEVAVDDLLYLLGTTSVNHSHSKVFGELFLEYDRVRSGVTKVDERIKLAEDYKAAYFKQLSDLQREEMQDGLFAAQLRRYGIFAWAKSGEKALEVVKPIFLSESIKKMKEIAPTVASELRTSVNAVAVKFLHATTKRRFDSLNDLDFPFPIEIVLNVCGRE
jgi:flagellar biosynthesis chaperone FliJ